MRRHMSKNVIHPEHWPELSDGTMGFIESDEFASKLFERMRDSAWTATDWYEYAEKNRDVTRWVPREGGGDCFLIVPGDEAAYEFSGMYDALALYAETMGRKDVSDELHNMSVWFTCYDMSEAS